MRCTSFATAKAYDLSSLDQMLRAKCPTTRLEESLHFRYKKGEVFFFDFGAFVCWNLGAEEEQEVLINLKPYEIQSLTHVETDEFEFEYGDTSKMFQDRIILKDSKDILEKLAVSYAIAQSAKLAIYEHRIEASVESADKIIEALARKGRVPMSKAKIARKIGELFMERNAINLHTQILDMPDFFWEHPEYEGPYKHATKDLNISQRTLSLNRKLEMIHELFQILGDELNNRNAARLEWVIIILITLEVLIAFTSHYGSWVQNLSCTFFS